MQALHPPPPQIAYLNWSGIIGAIRNRGQRNRTVLARFANLDSSARWSILTTRDQRTILLASVPLDAHGWEPLPEGTALAICSGAEAARMMT